MSTFSTPTHVLQGKPFDAAVVGVVSGEPWALVTSRGWAARGAAARLGVPAAAIADVPANPSPDWVLARGSALPDVRFLVALGGGSAIDAAKALAAVQGAGGDGATLLAHLREGTPLPRRREWPSLIAVPTTAGTGSEVTPWATLWDGEVKRSAADERLRPAFAVLDPRLCASMPRALTLATGLDAAAHALESLWNRRHTPLTDALASQALALLREHLGAALEDPGALEHRGPLQVAALLAGMAMGTTQTALAHAMSYAFTIRRGLPHGLACGFLLPEVARFNAAVAVERLRPAASAFGCAPGDVPEALQAWLDALGVPEAVASRAAPDAADALGAELVHPARAANNIRPVDVEAARRIARAGLEHAARTTRWRDHGR